MIIGTTIDLLTPGWLWIQIVQNVKFARGKILSNPLPEDEHRRVTSVLLIDYVVSDTSVKRRIRLTVHLFPLDEGIDHSMSLLHQCRIRQVGKNGRLLPHLQPCSSPYPLPSLLLPLQHTRVDIPDPFYPRSPGRWMRQYDATWMKVYRGSDGLGQW